MLKKPNLTILTCLVLILAGVLNIAAIAFGTLRSPAPHSCRWEDCALQGWTKFASTWGYEEGTDGYLCEKIHFEHPDWNYETCENYLFSTSKN